MQISLSIADMLSYTHMLWAGDELLQLWILGEGAAQGKKKTMI